MHMNQKGCVENYMVWGNRVNVFWMVLAANQVTYGAFQHEVASGDSSGLPRSPTPVSGTMVG